MHYFRREIDKCYLDTLKFYDLEVGKFFEMRKTLELELEELKKHHEMLKVLELIVHNALKTFCTNRKNFLCLFSLIALKKVELKPRFFFSLIYTNLTIKKLLI